MRRTSVAAITLVLISFAALAGCSGDPQPKFEGAPPTTRGDSTETTAATTTPPAPSSHVVHLSPEQVVREWVAARDALVQDGDAAEVYRRSTVTCGSCRNNVEPVLEVYANGGKYETAGWRIKSVKATTRFADPKFPETTTVVAAVIFLAGRTFQAAGSDPVSYAAEKHVLLFRLLRDPSQKVAFMGYLS